MRSSVVTVAATVGAALGAALGAVIAASVVVVIAASVAGCDRRVAGGSTDGATVYAAACATCHGASGKPPPAMADQLGVRDLTGPEFRGRRSQALIESQVRRGSANGRMPAFTGALSDAQIQAVTAYVLTLEPR